MSKTDHSDDGDLETLVGNMSAVYLDEEGNPRALTEQLSKSGGNEDEE